MIYFRPKLCRDKASKTLCVARPVDRSRARIARFVGWYRAVRATVIPGVYIAINGWHRDFHDYYEPAA